MSKFQPRLKSDIARFAYHVADNIRIGLEDRLEVYAGYDYKPQIHNGKRVILLKLANFPADKLDSLLKMEKQITIDSGLPESAKIRITFGTNRTAIIEVSKPKKLRNNVYLDDLLFHDNPYNVPIGLDTSDRQVNVDFSDPLSAHTLISGLTGSGKTVAQSYIAHSVMENTKNNTGVIMFDAVKKGLNFQNFDNHPTLMTPVIKDNDSAIAGLELVRHLVDNGITGGHDRVFIVVDELRFLIQDTEKGLETLSRVAALGRQFGISLLLATQYPQKQLLGKQASELVDNIGVMLCGKVKNAAMSTNALGLPDMGAEKLSGAGEFILVDSERSGTRVVFPWFEIDEIEPYPNRSYPTFEVETTDKVIACDSTSPQTFNVPVENKGGRPRNLNPDDWKIVHEITRRLVILTNGMISQTNLIETIKSQTGLKISFPQAKETKQNAMDSLRTDWLKYGIKFYTKGEIKNKP